MMEFDDLLEDIADAFCVGPQPLERWRPFVDLETKKDWTPEGEHERLLHNREVHARCVHEYTLLCDLATQETVKKALSAFRTCALLEMRYHEIALANFQILCGMVGIDNRTTDRDELYYAAMCCHSTHLYLHDVIAEGHKVKRSNRKDVLATRPSRTDTKTALARNVCDSIRAIHAYYHAAFRVLRAGCDGEEESELFHLGRRMRMVMEQLDRVLVVLTDERCDRLECKYV
jgi:hypothetical protein